jgi:hypothetical protein
MLENATSAMDLIELLNRLVNLDGDCALAPLTVSFCLSTSPSQPQRIPSTAFEVARPNQNKLGLTSGTDRN